jgi:hypothetical protein
MVPECAGGVSSGYAKTVITGSSSSPSGSGKRKEPDSLQQVHREVVEAFVPVDAENLHEDLPDPSYQKFLKSIVDSGSDKSFFILKKYKNVMDPIIETSEGCTGSGEKVDLGENESDFDSDSEESIDPRVAVLALAAPSLEHEHTAVVIPVEGPQPESDEPLEAFCSQVVDAVEDDAHVATIPVPSRASARQMAANNNNARIEDIAIHQAAARNLEGTNLSSHNSFCSFR